MIIIVEGIDRVGKTTLCHKLQEQLGFPIYKHKNNCVCYNEMDNINETDKMLQLLDLYSIMEGNVIFDRFCWSDFVYGIIERKYNINDANNNLDLIEKKLNELNALFILMKPVDIQKSSVEHGKNLCDYNNMFLACYVNCKCRKIICDYNSIEYIMGDVKDACRI